MFRIRPAVGILEPQRNEDVKVIFNACKILPEDSKHHSVVYHISAKNDVSVKKRRMYGELRGTIGNYYSCGAYKGTPTAALIPSPVASTPDESNLVVGSIRVSIDHDPLKNWQLKNMYCNHDNVLLLAPKIQFVLFSAAESFTRSVGNECWCMTLDEEVGMIHQKKCS